MDLAEAVARIDNWARDARVLKVTILSPLGEVDDSGWGGALPVGAGQLRVVYKRDSDEAEVDTVFDLSGATVSGSTIWDATSAQQQKFGHFDEVIGLALADGRVVLLMCAMSLPRSRGQVSSWASTIVADDAALIVRAWAVWLKATTLA